MSPDFVLTGLTGASEYGVGGANDHDRWGGPSVMVWAGISFHHRTPLVVIEGNLTARRYISDVLEEHAIPFIEQHPNLRIFQQDNARPHSANITSDYLRDHGLSSHQISVP